MGWGKGFEGGEAIVDEIGGSVIGEGEHVFGGAIEEVMGGIDRSGEAGGTGGGEGVDGALEIERMGEVLGGGRENGGRIVVGRLILFANPVDGGMDVAFGGGEKQAGGGGVVGGALPEQPRLQSRKECLDSSGRGGYW